jgi:uncharacterized protein DUF3800
MKFVYVDGSGSKDKGDVFVMAGLLIDAYRLRKHTDAFDQMISEFLAKHPGTGTAKELKTAALINGIGGWNKVNSTERKAFLESICGLATDCATVFSVAFSFAKFDTAANAGHEQPFGTSYWLGAATFVAALV